MCSIFFIVANYYLNLICQSSLKQLESQQQQYEQAAAELRAELSQVSGKLCEYEAELSRQCALGLVDEPSALKADREAFASLASLFERSRTFMSDTCSSCDSFLLASSTNSNSELEALNAHVRSQLASLGERMGARRSLLDNASQQLATFHAQHAHIVHFLDQVDARSLAIQRSLHTCTHEQATLRPLVDQCDELERELVAHQAQHARLARTMQHAFTATLANNNSDVNTGTGKMLDSLQARYEEANARLCSLRQALTRVLEQLARFDAHCDRMDDWFTQTKHKLKSSNSSSASDLSDAARFYDEMRDNVNAHRHMLADVHRQADIYYELLVGNQQMSSSSTTQAQAVVAERVTSTAERFALIDKLVSDECARLGEQLAVSERCLETHAWLARLDAYLTVHSDQRRSLDDLDAIEAESAQRRAHLEQLTGNSQVAACLASLGAMDERVARMRRSLELLDQFDDQHAFVARQLDEQRQRCSDDNSDDNSAIDLFESIRDALAAVGDDCDRLDAIVRQLEAEQQQQQQSTNNDNGNQQTTVEQRCRAMLDECWAERDQLSARVNERLDELRSLGDARESYERACSRLGDWLAQMAERVPTDFDHDNAINQQQQDLNVLDAKYAECERLRDDYEQGARTLVAEARQSAQRLLLHTQFQQQQSRQQQQVESEQGEQTELFERIGANIERRRDALDQAIRRAREAAETMCECATRIQQLDQRLTQLVNTALSKLSTKDKENC